MSDVKNIIERHELPLGPLTRRYTLYRKPKGSRLHLSGGCLSYDEYRAAVNESVTFLDDIDRCPKCFNSWRTTFSFPDSDTRFWIIQLETLAKFDERLTALRRRQVSWDVEASTAALVVDLDRYPDHITSDGLAAALVPKVLAAFERAIERVTVEAATFHTEVRSQLDDVVEHTLVNAVLMHSPERWLPHDQKHTSTESLLIDPLGVRRSAAYWFIRDGEAGIRSNLGAYLKCVDEKVLAIINERGPRTPPVANPVTWLRNEWELYLDELAAAWSAALTATRDEITTLADGERQVLFVEPFPNPTSDGVIAAALTRSTCYRSVNRPGSGLVVTDPLAAAALGRDCQLTVIGPASAYTSGCLTVAMELWDPRNTNVPLADLTVALTTAQALN